MAVEIAQLVLRGSFGPARPDDENEAEEQEAGALQEALDTLRRELLVEMREMIEDAARRRRES